ncbi:hypothetical protein AWJ07_00330 [Shewanella frigidimarina]|uniref:Uncharacterized protein n=1 Tax=Shewanella frigidimarina TaxID=56812 RepID=A0A106C2I8_SHEFR|nr:hypothetical protein AWJ07_00330 [Shewanella frigidimarina]
MKQSMSFKHIQTKWPQLYQLSAFAEESAMSESEPQNSLVKLRFLLSRLSSIYTKNFIFLLFQIQILMTSSFLMTSLA